MFRVCWHIAHKHSRSSQSDSTLCAPCSKRSLTSLDGNGELVVLAATIVTEVHAVELYPLTAKLLVPRLPVMAEATCSVQAGEAEHNGGDANNPPQYSWCKVR